MKTTRAKDLIQLTDIPGREPMTLGEALDRGLVELTSTVVPHRTREQPNGKPSLVTLYTAWQTAGERAGWTVGRKLYESRTRKSHQT